MAVVNLTEKRIRDLALGSGIHRDEQVRGLMVICHKSTKTYAVQGDVRRNGRHVRTVRVKIDRVDRIGLNEARRRAKGLMSQIQGGVDLTAKPAETGITLAQALEEHVGERSLSGRTEESYRDHLDRLLVRFRKRAVTDITRQEVRDLFDDLKRKHGVNSAAGAMRTMRAVINTARRIDETIGANPVDGVRVPAPRKREVDEMDLKAFWARTEELSPIMRDLQRTFLLTGARRLSVLSTERAHVDHDRKILRFAHMKTGGDLLFPMGTFLADMLEKRMEADGPLDSKWLWPSPLSTSGRLVEPKRSKVPSPHALRHHARTLMIAAGVPYAESALLLGHSLPGATGGYVHRAHLVEALRTWAQKFETYVLAQAGVSLGEGSSVEPAVVPSQSFVPHDHLLV